MKKNFNIKNCIRQALSKCKLPISNQQAELVVETLVEDFSNSFLENCIRQDYEILTPENSTEKIILPEGIEIDENQHTCLIKGNSIKFSKKEFELFRLFAVNRGRVFSREMLLNLIWTDNKSVGDRTVDVHITMIRNKIGKYFGKFIQSKKGVGFRFKTEEEIAHENNPKKH